MANRSVKLGQFHGGINDNSDARDIAEDEISVGVDCAVNRIGRLGLIGGVGASVVATANYKPLKGIGFFYYSTDQDKNTEPNGNSEDWLAIYDSISGSVVYYYRDKSQLNGSSTVPAFDTARTVSWIPTANRDDVLPNFFMADGILRYSDGNFDNAFTPNKVSQYVNNFFFERNSAQSSSTKASITTTGSGVISATSGVSFSGIVVNMKAVSTALPDNCRVNSVNTSASPHEITLTKEAIATSTNVDITFSLDNLVTRQAWVTGNQELKSFEELGATLTLDDSQTEGPDDNAIGNTAGNLVLSYWTGEGEDNGNWNGSFEYAASPMYHQGGIGPITQFDGVTNFHNDLVAFQLHITLGTTIDDDAHPFDDDRIDGVRVWFRSHGADKWHKLKDFEMKRGGKHKWESYDGNSNKAWGIFTGAITNPAIANTDSGDSIKESYKETTMTFTITNSASGFSGRKGFIRVWGVYNEPQWLNTYNYGSGPEAIDLSKTSQAYSMTITTPGLGSREFRVELLDESFNVLVKSAKTKITIADSGDAPPPTYNDDTDSS